MFTDGVGELAELTVIAPNRSPDRAIGAAVIMSGAWFSGSSESSVKTP